MTKEDIIKILKDTIKSVEKNEEISLHNINLLLAYSLKGIDSKKDLYPIDIENIKSIRNTIKGL